MDQPNEDQEEPPIAELLGVKKKKKNKNKMEVSSPRTRTTTGVKAKKKGGPAAVDSAAQYPTGSAEDCCNAPKVTVLKFDNSVENHFRAIDTISQLCGEPEDGALEEQEIQRLSSSITFLREWKYFNYEPKIVRFASAVGSIEVKDVVSGIELPQLSSAAVPKNEEPSGGAATHAESSGSGCSKDFVIHVGGHVWALDWCPRVHERPECPIKCEFIAVATHPPGSSYHKIGAPLTGRGVVQIWGLLNVSMNEDEVPPPAEKPKRGPKNSRDMKDKSTVSKRPRGRPRKKLVEDNVATTTQKRPRGRPRKNLIEKPPDNLDCSEQYVQALAVQFPEDSSDFLAIDGVLGDTQEHAVQEDNGKKQKSYKQAASKCNPALETPLKCRRLKNKKRTRSCSDNTSPLLLELIEDMGSSDVNQIQAEPAASVNFSHNGSLEISSAGCLIPNDVALPRVVFCLAHNGKVAWDAKWRPSNACDSIKMGYLAVLLGNGSLEVWEVPLPRTVKVIYSSDHPEGTDPRFVKLEPVFRCSMLKGGGTQSIPLTVEWSASPPHDLILAGCHDGTVALWKFSISSSSKDTRPLLCFSADTVPIRALAWAPVESDPESANVILTAGHGGLKFWDLRINTSFQFKNWIYWRYQLESKALWKNVIDVKYGSLWEGWCSKASSGAYGVSLWKFIRKGWDSFSNNFRLKMGDGKRILFWHDLWCGDTAPKLEFPALFRIARDQNAAVCDLYCSSNSKVEWNVIFKRDVHDWEVDEVTAQLVKLYSSKLVRDREDCMLWILAGNAKFSVSSYYRIFSSHSSCVFPWKSIWKVKDPSKVVFFCWVATLDRVLTTNNLRRRGLFIADWCVLCKRDGESVNHLFLQCEVTRFLWNEVLSWTGLHWVMPREVVDLLVGWKGVKGFKKTASVWEMIPPCLMWCIWLERIGRCFDDRERSLGDLKGSIPAFVGPPPCAKDHI